MNNFDAIEEILKNAVKCLTVKRGRFYADKNFGSKIQASQSNAEILAYARHSVDGLDGVFVKSAAKNKNSVTFVLTVNGEERSVIADFD